MGAITRLEVEDFYFLEAALLDDRDFNGWLALMSPDIRYWSPVREDIDPAREDFSMKNRLTHFDEVHPLLALRVRRLAGESVHSDTPPARLRHFITNVRILEPGEGVVRTASNFLCFKSRLGEETFISGRRIDRLRVTGGGFKCEERCIIFDHSALPSLTSFY